VVFHITHFHVVRACGGKAKSLWIIGDCPNEKPTAPLKTYPAQCAGLCPVLIGNLALDLPILDDFQKAYRISRGYVDFDVQVDLFVFRATEDVPGVLAIDQDPQQRAICYEDLSAAKAAPPFVPSKVIAQLNIDPVVTHRVGEHA